MCYTNVEGDPMLKRTMYLSKIMPFIDQNIIKVLTGIRRSGKSTILKQISDFIMETHEHPEIVYFNFDSKSFDVYKDADVLYQTILKKNTGGRLYVLLDEIQEVTGWEKVVNSLLIDGDYDLYITGSNSKLLSGELSTYIAGRYVSIEILPFSFSEYLEYHHDRADEDQLFWEYLQYGGMPQIAQLPIQAKETLLHDIYNSIVIRDLVERYDIRDVHQLKRVIAFVFDNIGNLFSISAIIRYLTSHQEKINRVTLVKYLDCLENVYLIAKVPRYDIKGKKLLSTEEKYYCIDTGMRNLLKNNEVLDISKLFENIVYLKLIQMGYEVRVGKVNNQEIDFIAYRGNEKAYYQVSYILQNQETIDREFRVFDLVKDHYPKYVISYDKFDLSRNGIQHKFIIDFLKE